MADPLSSEAVLRIAALSKLAASPQEVDRLRTDLGAILGYMDVLKNVEACAAAAQPASTNRLGHDEPGPMLPRSVLLEMAPATQGPFIAIPKVIGEGL